jgi:Cdc6-like AAA superfamily ATPase
MLFMNAGRSAPRYQDMALLYPRSKRLRDALCEYFIVILNVCKHAVDFLQKSPLSQFTSAISDSCLVSFEKDLQQWSVVIVEEVTLLSSQSLQEEARENSRFRQIMVKLSDSRNRCQQVALRIRILDACSTYDYQTSWKQARKQGTTTWFASTSEYQRWKGTPSSCALLCTGKLGSGKTTLLANVVDDLFCSASKASVAYFFCRFDVSDSLTARTIIGCLARQLLAQQPIDLTKIDNFWDNSLADPDEQAIVKFVQKLLSVDPIYSLVVDGLDECPEKERKMTLEILQQLRKHLKIRMCLSFRQDAGDHAKVAAGILNAQWTLPIPENNPDIDAYIDAELRERLESERLCIRNPAIILSIQHALVTGAQGMYVSPLHHCLNRLQSMTTGSDKLGFSGPHCYSTAFAWSRQTRQFSRPLKAFRKAFQKHLGEFYSKLVSQTSSIAAGLCSWLWLRDGPYQWGNYVRHSVSFPVTRHGSLHDKSIIFMRPLQVANA